MPTQLIVHSLLHGSTLLHSVQSDNLGRLEHATRHLLSLGYELRTLLRSEGGYHEVSFFSLHDRDYARVPRSRHSDVLRALRISVNNAHVTPTVISTYATVRHSRSRRRRPASPVRRPSLLG